MTKLTTESSPRDDESAALHNLSVEKALKDYCHFPHSQGFAVMLNGRWGSGKTHFINRIKNDLVPPGKDATKNKPLYVSLYGVQSAEEIGDQLFQQLHPVLGHKATRLFGAVLRNVVKATVKVDFGAVAQLTGALPDLDLSSMLSGSEGRVIIFDDLERAVMTPVAILGYINPLVEHDNCKVLILADEDQIKDQEDYKKRKEKTVGRTFTFKADAWSAFSAFLNQIDETDARSFLEDSKTKLLQVFVDSGLNNLRLLKQFLWDFERLWKTLTPVQRSNQEAMSELVSLLYASAIELRSGGQTAETFRLGGFPHYMSVRRDVPDETAVSADKMFKKYPTVQFDSTLFEPETIVDIVLKSTIRPDQIQRQLGQHPYFAKQEDMPSWRALWLSPNAPVQEHGNIVGRFDADFAARTFRGEAEITHIIGLSLWLSELGFDGWEDACVVEKVKQYISDVYGNDAAPPDRMRDSRLDSSGGAFNLGYRNTQDPRFGVLVGYHSQKLTEWRQRAYPGIAAELRRLMTEDSDAFLRDICFTNAGKARFARLGVLRQIPAGEFAATIIDACSGDQKNVMMALTIRYEQVTAELELEQELPWLREVQQQLHERGKSLPPIARYHLSGLVAQYVDITLVQADARLRERNPRNGGGTAAAE